MDSKAAPAGGATTVNQGTELNLVEKILNLIDSCIRSLDYSSLSAALLKRLSIISILITLIVSLVTFAVGVSLSGSSLSVFFFPWIFLSQSLLCIVTLMTQFKYPYYIQKITTTYVVLTMLLSITQAILFLGYDNDRSFKILTCTAKGNVSCDPANYSLPASLMVSFIFFSVLGTHMPIGLILSDLDTLKVAPEMLSIEKLNKPV